MTDKERFIAAMAGDGPENGVSRESDSRWKVGEEPQAASTGDPFPAIEGVVSPLTNSHFDPAPRPLCPDPVLGTREGWAWCDKCASIQPPNHTHYRPEES